MALSASTVRLTPPIPKPLPLLLFPSRSPKTLPFPRPLSLLPLPSLSRPTFINCVSTTAPVEPPSPAPGFDFHGELSRLRALRARISRCATLDERLRVLDSDSRVRDFFGDGAALDSLGLEPWEVFLLKCLVSAGQGHVIGEEMRSCGGGVRGSGSALRSVLYGLVEMIERWSGSGHGGVRVEVKKLVKTLGEVEKFYDSIGGIIGYQMTVLELLSSSTDKRQKVSWSTNSDQSIRCQFIELHVPAGLSLSDNTEYAAQAALWGIEGMPELGEIYPLGGSADRLGLVDPDTGEYLPAAMLPFSGRTLLQGLIRDLQAREFLYFKIYGKQCITPVAIMTSSAKNNHEHINDLCKREKWFGRGRSSFQLFEQPLVPVVAAEDGQWLINKPFTPVCKPGGHGAIWKLAFDKGIFQWFYEHGRKGATVRQVSNVVAATDLTILALAGIGLRRGMKLGFASCKRNSGATEGINVLVEKRVNNQWAYGLTCVEYTEFEKFGIMDKRFLPDNLQAEYPANTNILYVDLPSAEKVASSPNTACLPGMVLNLKKPITYEDNYGNSHSVSGGRLECTMQNIADSFLNKYSSRCYKGIEYELDTFIVYNERRRVTSSAKKKRKSSDKSLHQTPDGALLDITRNAVDLLSQSNVKIPKMKDNNECFHAGPPYLILLHPALGPLWEVTRQKFHGGSISKGSELQIEVAEFFWSNVQLEGSLLIIAENIMGSFVNKGSEPVLQYGNRCGRCRLENVKVLNKGIDWRSVENVFWKHDVRRIESLKIVLHGNAEFEASDVNIEGNQVFEVPNGYRLRVTAGNSGFLTKLDPIKAEMMDTGSWFWRYTIEGTHICLNMVEQ